MVTTGISSLHFCMTDFISATVILDPLRAPHPGVGYHTVESMHAQLAWAVPVGTSSPTELLAMQHTRNPQLMQHTHREMRAGLPRLRLCCSGLANLAGARRHNRPVPLQDIGSPSATCNVAPTRSKLGPH